MITVTIEVRKVKLLRKVKYFRTKRNKLSRV